jgi:type I restriction enzyme S subunit
MNNQNNNNLPKEWRKVRLGEIMQVSRDFGRKIKVSEYKIKGLIPIYDQGSDYISGYTDDLKAAYKGQLPAILFGDHTLRLRLINHKFAIGADGIQILEPLDSTIDRIFFYYLLKYAIKNLKSYGYERHLKYLRELEISYPEDPNEQKRIADILSAFDDKIEVNNKIIKTLEEMAREIFKEWFNENSKFKSQKSKLEGWKIGYLGDEICSEIIKPKVKKFEGEKIYLATADVEKNEIVNEKTKISYNNRPIRANMEPVLNSIWFAKMINTYKVLFFFEGNKDDIAKYILSTGFMGIKALKNMQYYLYLFINSKEFHQIKDTLVQGAVQEAITNTNVKQIKFLVPPENLLDEFNKKVEPLLIKAYKLRKENQKLAELRDLLLPKLMSGEIRA